MTNRTANLMMSNGPPSRSSQPQPQTQTQARKPAQLPECFTRQKLQYPPPGALVGRSITRLEPGSRSGSESFDPDTRSWNCTPPSVLRDPTPPSFSSPPTAQQEYLWIHETGQSQPAISQRGSGSGSGSRGGNRTKTPLSSKRVSDANLVRRFSGSIAGTGECSVRKAVHPMSGSLNQTPDSYCFCSAPPTVQPTSHRPVLPPLPIQPDQLPLYARRSLTISRHPIPPPIDVSARPTSYWHAKLVEHPNTKGPESLPTPPTVAFPSVLAPSPQTVGRYEDTDVSPPPARYLPYTRPFDDQTPLSDELDDTTVPRSQAVGGSVTRRSPHGLGLEMPPSAITSTRLETTPHIGGQGHERETINFTPRKPSLSNLVMDADASLVRGRRPSGRSPKQGI